MASTAIRATKPRRPRTLRISGRAPGCEAGRNRCLLALVVLVPIVVPVVILVPVALDRMRIDRHATFVAAADGGADRGRIAAGAHHCNGGRLRHEDPVAL